MMKPTARQNHPTQREKRELGWALKVDPQTHKIPDGHGQSTLSAEAHDTSLSPFQNWRLQLKAGVRVGQRCRILLDRMLG